MTELYLEDFEVGQAFTSGCMTVGRLVVDQPAAQADQDRRPRRPPRPHHHFPTGRGGRNRPHGQGHPDCDPPPPSVTFICLTAILTQTEQKRQDRSVHCAEKRRHRVRIMRVFGPTPIRPNSSA